MEYVYLGYGKFDAATNMAIDEATLKRVDEDRRVFIRFYDFERPTVILAKRESIEDVNLEKCTEMGFDVNRRLSHGSVILCDDTTISYSIVSPSHDPSSAHKEFSRKIAMALKELGVENVGIGEHFSVRIDGKTVAGHGQRYRWMHGLLYHGVMAVHPWNTELINDVIKLRPSPGDGKKDEYQLVRELPSVNDYVRASKNEVAAKILDSITGGNYNLMDISELYPDVQHFKETKYANHSWVYNAHQAHETPPIISKDQGFCFIDIIAPEGTVEMV
ncbi:MAG TPA: hypothetical protein VJI12_02580 [archaeon]|nr:hypothetical protein [archaeon]